MNVKYNKCEYNPFWRKRIFFKEWDEIIPLGIKNLDVENNHGEHLNYQQYDELINSNRCLHIDARSI